MEKYKQKELRELVRLGVAEDYTNKPSEYIYTLRRPEKVGYSTGVYGINGGLAGLDYKITYKAVTSSRLDSKALKADQPELYAKYTKQTTARRFCLA